MNKEQTNQRHREPLSFRVDCPLLRTIEAIAKREHRTRSLQAEMLLKAGMEKLYPEEPEQEAA